MCSWRSELAFVGVIALGAFACAHTESMPMPPDPPPPDLAPARDLAVVRDLAVAPDLAPVVDLARPADLLPPAQTWTVRLRVSGVEINRGVYAQRDAAALMTAGLSSLVSKPRACPDLSWTLFADSGIVADSKTVKCRYSASWPKSVAVTTTTRQFHLVIFDRGHEVFARFEWTPEELRAAIAAKKSLHADAVMALRLDGSEIALRQEQ